VPPRGVRGFSIKQLPSDVLGPRRWRNGSGGGHSHAQHRCSDERAQDVGSDGRVGRYPPPTPALLTTEHASLLPVLAIRQICRFSLGNMLDSMILSFLPNENHCYCFFANHVLYIFHKLRGVLSCLLDITISPSDSSNICLFVISARVTVPAPLLACRPPPLSPTAAAPPPRARGCLLGAAEGAGAGIWAAGGFFVF